jgi:UDP-N-acetylmuramate--alanine ligase
MIAVMLTQAGLDPTAVIGGRLDVFASSARLGKGELMVVEADESDRSFLYLLPSIAVVTNIDREHLDHYRDLNEIASAFLSFVNKVPFYGAVVACADAPWGERFRELFPQLRRRVVTYGLDPGADVQGTSIRLQPQGSCFEVEARAKHMGSFAIRVPGRHNVQNALAAVAVGLELDLSAEEIRRGLDCFQGVDRRFQIKAEFEGITIVDDYGHHPTEIRATLEAARLWGAKRVIAIFQPHRYTRTLFLMDDFANSFQATDRVYVLDVYPASEKPIPGVTSQRLVERMAELGFERARYAPSEQAVIQGVLEDLRPGDMILTVGAGSVGRIGDTLAEAIRGRSVRLGAVQG